MSRKTSTLGLAFVLFFSMAITVGAEWSGPWPDTGQTKCYDNQGEIPCPELGEPFYGQDAQYKALQQSYTKLGHGGVELPDDALHVDADGQWTMTRDNVTGLVWELKINSNKDEKYYWQDAHDAFIPELNNASFGGFSDWRMPTIKELSSLGNAGNSNPAIDVDWFPKTASSLYWSSTTSTGGESGAWLVSVGGSSGACSLDRNTSCYVRAVRAGQGGSLDNLVINGDGTVTDPNTGLMWQEETAPGRYTWQQALSYAAGLFLAGYSDWRIPNRNELQSLVDYSRFIPALDPLLSSNTVSSYYWSSTTRAGMTSYAWYVDFSNGCVRSSSAKSSSYYVRAVRAGQNRLLDHLVILSPAQASKWTRDENMLITWDTADIEGNVNIALSRDGGKTFETIAEEVPNNGSFDWTVTGPGSVNCMMEIVPLADPTKKAIQGLFSIHPISVTLTYTAGVGGSITGNINQTVDLSDSGTAVTAVPDLGYHFFQWSDGRSDNPRTDTNVQGSITVTASFVTASYSISYSAGLNGTVTGETNQTVHYGADATPVHAVPDPGYQFVHWSDGVKTASRKDTNVTMDIAVRAFFHLPGDVDANNRVDLADAILALQVISGIATFNSVHIGSDVSGDGIIGLSEAIYALQCVARLRNNHTPVLSPIGNKIIDEMSPLTIMISASDGDNDPLTFSTSPLPSGATFNAVNQTFSWTPTYSQSGIYQVTFSVIDDYGGSASETVVITVNNKILFFVASDYFPLNIGDWQDFKCSSTGLIQRSYTTGPRYIGDVATKERIYWDGQKDYYTSDVNGVKIYGQYLISPYLTGDIYFSTPLLLMPNNTQIGATQVSNSTYSFIYSGSAYHVNITSTVTILELEDLVIGSQTLLESPEKVKYLDITVV